MEELQNWNPVLERLSSILSTYGNRLSNYNSIELKEDNIADMVVVKKALRFLAQLMKAGRDKRYFLAFEVITRGLTLKACSMISQQSSWCL